MERRRHPLNATGDFYVEDGACMACTACTEEAPDLMAMAFSPSMHCYFKRQPANMKEDQQAILALAVSCCGQVRYSGRTPALIEQLVEWDYSDRCDQLPAE